jgi:transcriptional regulator with XRE-family HTH domain
MKFHPNIGGRIKSIRVERGFTQVNLVKSVNGIGIKLSQSQLSAIENGNTKDPGVYKVRAIAKVLGANIDDFVLDNDSR